ncbi:PP-loop family-domain-containing protein [Lactarius pseudohatsudake]|nr:PP-loop family-domain-containing protein [Lactarius pseudohatsudake]
MHLPQIQAITNAEFVQMMGRCRPPTGWPTTLVVASSAGPDSHCLLYLLRRMIDLKPKDVHGSGGGLPDAIVSFHVNHNLQANAPKMALAASNTATRFKVASHVELNVRWGEAPFPARPRDGDAVETLARNARYQLMFEEMVRRNLHMLAAGHHADDQVETVLMRLGAGSSMLGLGGMRPLRRFGMSLGKGANDFGWFGHEGLNRWVVRPLLEVSKDRILETCHLHRIHYVLDRTNFQPELTLRNALRHVLASKEKKPHLAKLNPPSSLPPVLADQITRMKTASENMKMPVPIDFMSSRQNLREAVRCLSRNLSDIESRASTFLSRFSVQTPPGTFTLTSDKLSTAVTDPLVQSAMVLRILRYISPHPWGSTRAQANRRRERLQHIIERVWDPDPVSGARAGFGAGANVLWTPFRISQDGKLKHRQPRSGERFGWLASRALPPRHCWSESDRDISALLTASSRQYAEVLHDNRFLVSFRLRGIPAGDPIMASVEEGSGRVLIVLGGRWLWPKVIWRREGQEDVTIAQITVPELDWYEPPPGVRRNYSTRPHPVLSEKVEEACPSWQDIVNFKFIRVLDEP